jgi:hypothetical protein
MKGKGLALVFGKPSASAEDEGEEEYGEDGEYDFDTAAEELLAAVKSDDVDALKDALRRAIESC